MAHVHVAYPDVVADVLLAPPTAHPSPALRERNRVTPP
jgi:hypothetical protein